MAMDAKDLRTEAVLGDRSKDGNAKYNQGGTSLPSNRTKPYQDIGSNSLAKVDVQAARPCAVIGPDRVVPPPAASDAYLKKGPVEPWLGTENTYLRPPEYPHKPLDYPHPVRNISPRQTFQENMQRIMVPPSYSSLKLKEDHNFPMDANISSMRNNKLNIPSDPKYCDVPYNNSMTNEQKNIRSSDISVSNMNSVARSVPHGWPLNSANTRSAKPYGAPELYQYPEYSSCAGPRPMLMPRPHRTIHEESGPIYPDPYYQDGSIRFKPYPSMKERFPQPRYDYIANYSTPFHPPPFPSHKYELQKPVPSPHAYPGYSQVPIKYIESRMPEPIMNGYQRSNQQPNFNNVSYRNQMLHPTYGPVPGNCLQPNKYFPFPPDTSVKQSNSNKLPYDSNNKIFTEGYYVNDLSRPHYIKGQILPPNYGNMYGMPPHPYYRKENPSMKSYEFAPHIRNIDPSMTINGTSLSRFPLQFSPSTFAYSPADSNTSNDTNQTQGTSQDDCGYISQSSSASIRSMDSGINRMPHDFYRRYDQRYNALIKSSSLIQKLDHNSNMSTTEKKDLDVRQFLQMWNEGEDEGGDHNGSEGSTNAITMKDIGNGYQGHSQEQLYVLGLVNVPSEELSKYEHIQKVSKLPENIKGYNSIELLHQFEEVIESSNLNSYNVNLTAPRSFDTSSKSSSTSLNGLGIPPRPISPLDVEAKISQSVIHKEVGCNFEIKPCSPKMLNVEIAAPVQTVLGERAIEKVSNPLLIHSPIISNTNENMLKCQEKRINENISSCKMIDTQYPRNEHETSVKTNYILQDLESNSGVCLASLPRLDNDIELNFPEVNQQFINANKAESVITTAKDLPMLEQTDLKRPVALEVEQTLLKNDSDKDLSKLSKYRKIKQKNSEAKEQLVETSVQALRTDSVIIKNPENLKNQECVGKSPKILSDFPNPKQQDPINLTVNAENRMEQSSLNENEGPHDFDLAIDFSTSSIEHTRKNIRTPEKSANVLEADTKTVSVVEKQFNPIDEDNSNQSDISLDYTSTEVSEEFKHLPLEDQVVNFAKIEKTRQVEDNDEVVLKTYTESNKISDNTRNITSLNSSVFLAASNQIGSVNVTNELTKANNSTVITSNLLENELESSNGVEYESEISQPEKLDLVMTEKPPNVKIAEDIKVAVEKLVDKPLFYQKRQENQKHASNTDRKESLFCKIKTKLNKSEKKLKKMRGTRFSKVKCTSKSTIAEIKTTAKNMIKEFDNPNKRKYTFKKELFSTRIQNLMVQQEGHVSSYKYIEEKNSANVEVKCESDFFIKIQHTEANNEMGKSLSKPQISDANVYSTDILKENLINEHNVKATVEDSNSLILIDVMSTKDASVDYTINTNSVIKVSSHIAKSDTFELMENSSTQNISDCSILEYEHSTFGVSSHTTKTDDSELIDNSSTQNVTDCSIVQDENTTFKVSSHTIKPDVSELMDSTQNITDCSIVEDEKATFAAKPDVSKVMDSTQNITVCSIIEDEKATFVSSHTETADALEQLDNSSTQNITDCSIVQDENATFKVSLHIAKPDVSELIDYSTQNITDCLIVEDEKATLEPKSDVSELMDSAQTITDCSIIKDEKATSVSLDTVKADALGQIGYSSTQNISDCSIVVNEKATFEVSYHTANTDVFKLFSNPHSQNLTDYSIVEAENVTFEESTVKTNASELIDNSSTQNITGCSIVKDKHATTVASSHTTTVDTYELIDNSTKNVTHLYNNTERVETNNDNGLESCSAEIIVTSSDTICERKKDLRNEESMGCMESDQYDLMKSTVNEKINSDDKFVKDDQFKQHSDLFNIDPGNVINPLVETSRKEDFKPKKICKRKLQAYISSDTMNTQNDTSDYISEFLPLKHLDNSTDRDALNESIITTKENTKQFDNLKDDIANEPNLSSYGDKSSNITDRSENPYVDNCNETMNECHTLDLSLNDVNNKNIMHNMCKNENMIEGVQSPIILEQVLITPHKSQIKVKNVDENNVPEKSESESISIGDDNSEEPTTGNNDIYISLDTKFKLSTEDIRKESYFKSEYSDSDSENVPDISCKYEKEPDNSNDKKDKNDVNQESEATVDEESGIISYESAKNIDIYLEEMLSDLSQDTVEIIRDTTETPQNHDIKSIQKISNFRFKKRKSLKRSFSESALDELCDNSADNCALWPNKKQKIDRHEKVPDHFVTNSYCNIIHHNRRNSVSSMYTEENVSFCILIENNCILTEEDEAEKICYAEIPEDCLPNEEDCLISTIDKTVQGPQESCEESYDCTYSSTFAVECREGHKSIENSTWVDDVACIETVVSDDIAENIVISATVSPKEFYETEEDYDQMNEDVYDDHTEKVKYIYGEKMCSDDAYLVETLYRTPQKDVRTLINRESQVTEECNRYYDKESLEKVLSDANGENELKTNYESSISNYLPLETDRDSLKCQEDCNKNVFEDHLLSIENNTRLIDTAFSQIEKVILEKEQSINHNSFEETQDSTIHSCEPRSDNVLSYSDRDAWTKRVISSSPEVSSTTSEERSPGILLKITKYNGSRISEVNNITTGNRTSCKYTENKDYITSHSNLPTRPLITKAAQKYIPPIKDSIRDLKVKLPLPHHSLLKLKQLKVDKEKPRPNTNISNKIKNEVPKKSKPKFEDVLKSIDEIQIQKHKEKEKSKKLKKSVPKVVIKKNENGSHYASTSQDRYNPDLTGRKWQPWVFIERNRFVDKMAIKKKSRAVFSYRKNEFMLAEKFQKYKSVNNAKFVISQPNLDSSASGQLKYTIKLKHS